jgi:hypothetical protein
MYCENYEPMPFILAYKQEKSNKIHMISRIGAVAELGRKSWVGQTRAQRFAPKLNQFFSDYPYYGTYIAISKQQ